LVVEKASEASAGKLQRASGDRGGQADVSRRIQAHRCIIPASGYYEWLKKPDGRQPYFISAADGGVLSFAGLWDRWKNPETGEPVISCTIIVTDANELTRPIHDRMPVVLGAADIRPWLSGEAGTELLRPSSGKSPSHVAGVEASQQDRHRDDDPTLIEEVTA
jgi:putative SOS response-associated peptidase YedK